MLTAENGEDPLANRLLGLNRFPEEKDVVLDGSCNAGEDWNSGAG